jgi:hypothetical protein
VLRTIMSEFKFNCPGCGQHISATEAWSGQQIQCPTCQRLLTVPNAPAVGQSIAATTAPSVAGLKLGGAPTSQAPSRGTVMPGSGGLQQAPKTSGLAIASLVCGIVSLLCGLFLGIPAVICGHMALKRIKAGRSSGGNGMAIAGLVMGYIMTVVSVVLIIIRGVAVYMVLQQMRQGK